jgi:CRISPR-associated protein Csd2
MITLQNKIDFAFIFRVKSANPNGDPLNGNRPRTDYNGYGELTDVCIKRKLRDRLLERYKNLNEKERHGQGIFVQSDHNKIDNEPSLRARAESEKNGLGKSAFKNSKTKDETIKAACAKWFDVRAFGQLLAFKSKDQGSDGVSIHIRGPVSIHSAFSVEPITITTTQITKSVNSDGDGSTKGSDTMGSKHRVDLGIYSCYGSINPQLAERTGFSDEDAATFKSILPIIFENDASTSRPEGSMEIIRIIWWNHNCKSGQYSSAKVHKSLVVNNDGSYELAELPGLIPEQISGF